MKTAVAFFIYRRPELTKLSFRAIREAKPETLYVFADGPRSDSEAEVAECREARAVTEEVDWPCRVTRHYSDTNMGLKNRMESGLDLLFKSADRAIILEDDCVASPSFFRFCEEMLQRYEHEEKVWAVNGSTPHPIDWAPDASYFYSGYVHVWGWATWADVWNSYRREQQQWFEGVNSATLKLRFTDRPERLYWQKRIKQVREKKVDSWAYSFGLWLRVSGGLALTPKINRIRNVGEGAGATHPDQKPKLFSRFNRSGIHTAEEEIVTFVSPGRIERNEEADRWYIDYVMEMIIKRFPWNLFLLPKRIFHRFKGFLLN